MGLNENYAYRIVQEKEKVLLVKPKYEAQYLGIIIDTFSTDLLSESGAVK